MTKVSFGKLLALFCFLCLPVLTVKQEDTKRLVTQTWVKVMDRTKMMAYNYNSICDKDSIESFPEVNFIKNFMAVEFNTDVHPDAQVNLLATDLYKLLNQLNTFRKSINVQLKMYREYPRSFMQAKFLTLINVTRARLGLAEHPETINIIEHSTKDKDVENAKRLASGRRDIMFELKGKEFDFDYLSAAKAQYLLASSPAKNVKRSTGYAKDLEFFTKDLPEVLYQILIELALENPDRIVFRQYFIDFFIVFGELIEEPEYAKLIFKFTATNGERLAGSGAFTYQDPNSPSLFKDLSIFARDRELGDYTPYTKFDMIPFKVDAQHRNPLELVEIRKKNNAYYPDWIKFFDFPNNLPEPLKIPEYTQPSSPFFRASQLIYYLYVNERSTSSLKPIDPENPAKSIADKLYNALLAFNCFDKPEPCSFSKFTDPLEFSAHFLPMLTLLKPFTSYPGPFVGIELGAIEKEVKKNGEEIALKHIKPVALIQPDIKKEIIKTQADTVSNKLGNLLNNLKNSFDDLTEEDLGDEPVDEDDVEEIEIPIKEFNINVDNDLPEKLVGDLPEKIVGDQPEKLPTDPKGTEETEDIEGTTSPKKEQPKPLSPEINKPVKTTRKHKRRQPKTGAFKDIGRESKIYDIIEQQEQPIRETIEETFPILVLPTTPDNIEDKIETVEILINGNKNNLPVQKHIMNKYIKEKIEDIKKATPTEEGKIKAKVNDLLNTTIKTTIDDVLNRTVDKKTEGLREYLSATIFNSFVKQNIEAGKNHYYKDRRYDLIRHYDIYTFVYYAKLKEGKTEALEIEREIQQFEPSFSVKELEESNNIHDYYQSLLFIGQFSKLFRLFKTKKDISKELNNSIEHIDIFHKVYQFLCDLRMAYGLKITLQKSFKDHRDMVATHLLNCFRYTYASTVEIEGNFYKNNFTPSQFCKVHRFSNDDLNLPKKTKSTDSNEPLRYNNFDHLDALFKEGEIENLQVKKDKWRSITAVCKYNFAFYSEIMPLLVPYLSFNNEKTIVDIFYDIVYDSGIPIINIANFNFLLESSGAHREGHITSELSNMYYTFCKESVSMKTYKRLSVDPEDEEEILESELPLMSAHEICSSYINFLKMRTFFQGADSTIETYKNGAANIMKALDLENVETLQQAQNIIFQIWETVTMFAQHKNGLGVANYDKLTALFSISLMDQLKSESLAPVRKLIKENQEVTLANYFGLKFGNYLANRYTATNIKFLKGISALFTNEETLNELLVAGDIFSNENAALLVSTANCPENFRAISKVLIQENQDKLLYTFTESKSIFQYELETAIETFTTTEEVAKKLKNMIYAKLAAKIPKKTTKVDTKNAYSTVGADALDLNSDFVSNRRRGRNAPIKNGVKKENYEVEVEEEKKITNLAKQSFDEQFEGVGTNSPISVVLVSSDQAHEFVDISTNFIKEVNKEKMRRRRLRVLV